jgi:hypothetical protein
VEKGTPRGLPSEHTGPISHTGHMFIPPSGAFSSEVRCRVSLYQAVPLLNTPTFDNMSGAPPQYSQYPPPQGYPPQGYPPQGYPPQGYPPQGYPPQQQYGQQHYPPQQGYGYPQPGASSFFLFALGAV